MLEVCSTTLPQFVIPKVYESEQFKLSLLNRIEKYKIRAKKASEIFSDTDLVSIVEPK